MANEKEKKHTKKSATFDLDRAQKAHKARLERLAKMQAEIDRENERIKELEEIVGSIYVKELTEKLTRETAIKDSKLSDDQISTLVELTKEIVESINTLDIKAVKAAIKGEIENKKATKAEKPSPQIVEIEPPAPQEDVVENKEDDEADTEDIATSSNPPL